MTVVETHRFLTDAKPLLSDSERADLVAFIGANPEAGQIILKPPVCGNFGGDCPEEESGAVLG